MINNSDLHKKLINLMVTIQFNEPIMDHYKLCLTNISLLQIR